MNAAQEIADWLAKRPHGDVGPGLSDAELVRAEETFSIRFAPLWRAVLGLVQPVPPFVAPQPRHHPRPSQYPDWRLGDVEQTRRLVDAPADGLLFDIAENDFWWLAWGPRPSDVEERLAVARAELAEVPRLTPLFGLLHVADTDDSPVFWINQAHVAIAAVTLPGLIDGRGRGRMPAEVPFWSELHQYSQAPNHFPQLATGGLTA